MAIKTKLIKFIEYGSTALIPTASSGQYNLGAVGGRLYAKDSGGNVFDLQGGTPVARTASADGTGTGTIAKPNVTVLPTSGNAAHIIVLPTMAVGDWVRLLPDAGATGYEIRSWDVGNVNFNNVAGAAGLELAVAAATEILVRCTATNKIVATKWGNTGTPASAGTPDV